MLSTAKLPPAVVPTIALWNWNRSTRSRLQTGEARFERRGNPGADLARLGGRLQAHLVPDMETGLQRLDDAAQILLRPAFAILRGGVEIIDAELQRASNRAFLVGRRTADHEPADRAAAETEQRDVETGLAEPALFHHRLLIMPPDQIAPDRRLSIYPNSSGRQP